MKLEGYLKLSARLDDLINFQEPERDRRHRLLTASAAGIGAGTGLAAGAGLYRRGLSEVSDRGVFGTMAAGAKAVPGDVRGWINRVTQPTAPAAAPTTTAAAPPPAAAARTAARPAVRPAARVRPNSPHLGDLPSVESLKKQLAKLKKVKK